MDNAELVSKVEAYRAIAFELRDDLNVRAAFWFLDVEEHDGKLCFVTDSMYKKGYLTLFSLIENAIQDKPELTINKFEILPLSAPIAELVLTMFRHSSDCTLQSFQAGSMYVPYLYLYYSS